MDRKGIEEKIKKMKLLILLLPLLLISCSYLPEPLNNPAVSTFGKKCNGQSWSYIWIHTRGEELTATKEKCKKTWLSTRNVVFSKESKM